ncbi:MAG: HNH endonuclease [Moritella sp.]|uniref:HNH endonuclease n=1 Tax=Moritella sp. TaxID=78556 RepID=UPI001D5C631C|nr:HNH endonuclease [Moritella sp.]NQZ50402.1 HNH endonuclease [Moritella sp.]
MAYYWVNVGTTHQEMVREKLLWAPLVSVNKNGVITRKSSWDTVVSVQAGDVIFCCKNTHIISVVVAKKDAFKSPVPQSRSSSKTEGNKVIIDLVELKNPLAVAEFKEEFIFKFNEECSEIIFSKENKLCQKYMVSIPDLAAAFLLNLIGEDSVDIQQSMDAHKSRKNSSSKKLAGIDKKVIAKARVGQGPFRKDVLKLWKNTCPVTNVDDEKLLIASHIVSWQLSTPEEKVDGYNGLPLSPNADKLFDKGLISFTDNGVMLLGDGIAPKLLEQLGINPMVKISGLKNENYPYLKRHRELHGFES